MSPIVKTVILNHFNPLNEKYEVLQFKDVPMNGFFRHKKAWKTKVQPHYAIEKSTNLLRSAMTTSIENDEFVLLITDKSMANRILTS